MTNSPIPIPACKHFTGYKPCFPGEDCLRECVQCQPIGTKILIVNLDAMGNVLATTALLPALKRKYPESTIYWITLKNAAPLLRNNPFIDRVYIWEPENWLILGQMSFHLVLNVDKSQRSCAFTMSVQAAERRGFGLNADGKIIPLNPAAVENYRLGLDDHLKFHVNQKTVPQLQCEQFELEFRRDDYVLVLSSEEQALCREYKAQHRLDSADLVVGFNTGCSELYPNKKMTVEQHVRLIERLAGIKGVRLVLLGGPEDTIRNAEIARRVGEKVLNTPTTEGVRQGICYINLCDLVISGDSFGMHAAIALKKEIVVWFGVSCWTEIDLFDRGIKLIPEKLACSPCWKRACPYNLECIQQIDLEAIIRRVQSFKAERTGAPS
jgi:ADP-heptose:LPS heptosyltransferase